MPNTLVDCELIREKEWETKQNNKTNLEQQQPVHEKDIQY